MNDVFKALSDPTRRGILRLLRGGPLPAGDIASHFPISKPTLSGHLAVLRAADLVDADRQGTSLIYHLKLSVLEEAMLTFSDAMRLRGATPAAPDHLPEAEPEPVP